MENKKRKFFYDFEFMEEPGSIEVISVGIVTQQSDGPELYLCNRDADLTRANDWVKENVVSQLPEETSELWVSKKRMRDEVKRFLAPSKKSPVELWGYYSSYDHVALCWLFGRMIDLPAGMPMMTMDVKQLSVDMGIEIPNTDKEEEHNALSDARWNRWAFYYIHRKLLNIRMRTSIS
jgi:hypothetical protein